MSEVDHSATLSEVARHAGVSLATASRVLNGSTRQVTQSLRERVLASASTLRYSPHGPAQAVARGTSQFVALVIGDIADPYFASIAAGLTREADRRGLTVAIAPTGADPVRETSVIAALRAQRPRALVVSSSRTRGTADADRSADLLLEIARMGAGIAYLGGEATPQLPAPVRMLQVANRAGGAALATELLAAGYRRFGVLSGPPDLLTSMERVAGFVEAVTSHGAAAPEQAASPLTRSGGYEATHRLLAADPRPQCLFAVTDMMAVGAMAALRENGLVPGVDVAVAGFDDIALLQDVRPALTTVALPLPEIGEHLLRLALDGLDPGLVPGSVRWRESTPSQPPA